MKTLISGWSRVPRGRWTSHKYMWKWMGLWCFLNGFLGQGEDLQSLDKSFLILKSFNGQMVWGGKKSKSNMRI